LTENTPAQWADEKTKEGRCDDDSVNAKRTECGGKNRKYEEYGDTG
jgi:hypothetical protein